MSQEMLDSVAVAGAAAAEHAEKPFLLSYDPGVAIWTLATFLILLVLLKKFAWTPILSALEEREKYIKDSLSEADQAKSEGRHIIEQQKKILADANAKAGAILAEADKAAKDLRQKMEQQAIEERARILSEADRMIAAEKDKAMRELRETVVKLSIEATRKLIDENLDETRSRALVEKQIGMI